ncbi:hypothetical protein TSOC_007183 [Tetrabaena socialis]|uniref:NF-kappa-B inhibitor-like protein 1 n=1 Tax=Tetrabaena socialis TaxID=47790 RepID=A0A2J8A1N2_9CHLO|nr:hypothetical protein TSOC_007183 [Tetrabaena socialis]|eukprot:PNH06427.1 hypothetical protein TSOC_007183 [Tetrabaena socialis]
MAQACACGNTGAVALLLSHGARAAAVDAAGDAPAHLAARGGQLEALAEVMQAPDAPALDSRGSDGLLLKQAMARALGGALGGGGTGGGAALRLQGPTGVGAAGGGAGRQESGGEDGGEEDEDEAQWRRRLREEYSDGEGADWGGGGGGGEDGSWAGWSDGAAARWAEAETEDAWADRLWSQMQRRRSAAAAASSAAFTASLRAEAARKAAEAAERSQRILQEEQAKDSQWRRRTLAIEAGPSEPQPLDLAASRAAYDQRWSQLDTELTASAAAAALGPLRYDDIPWPLQPIPPYNAAPRTAAAAAGAHDRRLVVTIGPPPPPPPPAAPPPPLTADSLRDFLLLGASGPADVRRRLRAELLRWHPDKFGARFGARLAAAGGDERERALARVQALAQVLTQVLGG